MKLKRIINAATGEEVAIGATLHGEKLVSVVDGLFSAYAFFEVAPGHLRRVDLDVTYTYPRYRFQRIGLIPRETWL